MSEIEATQRQEEELQQGTEQGTSVESPLETALAPGSVVDIASEQEEHQPATSVFLESLGHEPQTVAVGEQQEVAEPTPEPAVQREPFVPHQPTANETTPESTALRRVAAGDARLQVGQIEGLTPENVAKINDLLDRQTGPDAEANRATILRSLERVADRRNDLSRPELEAHRADLVNSLAHEITTPQDTHQGIAASCVATSMAIRMQREDPAEYARIVSGLSVDGQVTLAGGDTMTMYQGSGFIPDPSQGEWPGRAVSASVFQNSAMNYVSQVRDPEARYDNTLMRTVGPGGNYGGMFQDQAQQLNNQLFGTGSQRLDTTNSGRDGGISPQEATRQIDAALERQPGGVPVELSWSTSGAHMNHEVLVTAMTEDRVYIRNPHHHLGDNSPNIQQDSNGNYYMNRTEFESRLQSAMIDDPDRHPDEIQTVAGGYTPFVEEYDPETMDVIKVEMPNISPLSNLDELAESIERLKHRTIDEVEQDTSKKSILEEGAYQQQRRKDDEFGGEELEAHQRAEKKERGDDDEGSQPFVTPKDIS